MAKPLTIQDIVLANKILHDATGMRPNTVMLGKEVAESMGVEPGVYTINAAGELVYYTFEEWERR